MKKQPKGCFFYGLLLVKAKIGKANKYSNGFLNSPDGGDYPFVPVFGIKDSANQQENGLLKMPKLSLLNVLKRKLSSPDFTFDNHWNYYSDDES